MIHVCSVGFRSGWPVHHPDTCVINEGHGHLEPVSWDGVTHSYDGSAELFVNTP